MGSKVFDCRRRHGGRFRGDYSVRLSVVFFPNKDLSAGGVSIHRAEVHPGRHHQDSAGRRGAADGMEAPRTKTLTRVTTSIPETWRPAPDCCSTVQSL